MEGMHVTRSRRRKDGGMELSREEEGWRDGGEEEKLIFGL